MTFLALGLILLAACCHATWNFLIKRLDAGPELVWLFSALAALLYLPPAIAIFILQKPIFGVQEALFCFASATLHTAYFLLLQQGYRRGDLSLVYPTARATGPALSMGMAVVWLGEQPGAMTLAGAAIIIAGVFFLTGGIRARHLRTSLAFGVGAGIFIATYTVWDAYTVSVLLVPPLVLDYFSSLLRATALAPIAYARRLAVARLWREHRGAVLAIAVFNPLAYILVLVALAFTPVSYVAPAREVAVLLAVLLGTLVLGEGQTARRLSWAAVILLGMIVLSLG